MKRLSHRTRRRRLNRPTKRTITLTLEALEPRLVLSATGIGFEGVDERLDLHARDHGNREADHSAFAAKIHDGVDKQFALPVPRTERQGANSNRFDSTPPVPDPAGQARGGQPVEPFAANFSEFGRRGPRFNNQPAKPLAYAESAKGESTFLTGKLDDFSFLGSADDIFPSTLHTGTTIPSPMAVFVSLPPASSRAHGGESLNFGQPTTRLMQPLPTSNVDSVSQSSSLAATLPVVVSVSSPPSTRVSSTTPGIESSTIRFNSGSTKGDLLLAEPASEFRNVAVPDSATFVSLSQRDSANSWALDGESLEAEFASVDQPSDSVLQSIANERTTTSSINSFVEHLPGLSEESLWADFSDGGFVEIAADAADNSHERFDLAEESEDAPASKRLSAESPRDAFWFDFDDTRLDLIFDSAAIAELTADQSLDNADDADNEAWLLDDGGMIVLTSSQFIDQAVEVVAVEDTRQPSPTREVTADETGIPMDAGVGVFQAIEVATTLVEQQDDLQVDEGTTTPIEDAATAHADEAVPTAGQAAKNSESDGSDPIRAASMPLLLAISALFARGPRVEENHKSTKQSVTIARGIGPNRLTLLGWDQRRRTEWHGLWRRR